MKNNETAYALYVEKCITILAMVTGVSTGGRKQGSGSRGQGVGGQGTRPPRYFLAPFNGPHFSKKVF